MKLLFLILFISTSAFANHHCQYKVDTQKPELTWTAYKLPEKVGVPATFDEIKIQGKNVGSLAEILNSTRVEINPKSINSKNKARDMRIYNSFFKKMINSGKIQASFSKALKESVTLNLDFNGVKGSVPMILKLSAKHIILTGTFNILGHNAYEHLASLNKACEAKHKKGFTWADVALEVKVPYSKKCK